MASFLFESKAVNYISKGKKVFVIRSILLHKIQLQGHLSH